MKENIMGTKPVTSLLLGMSFPIMISMLVQALYNVVDSIFVARLSEASLTAVSFAYPIQMLTIAVSVGTSIGINALMSRRLGEGDRAAATRVAHNGLLLMVVSWLVFALFGIFFSDIFFGFFTKNPLIASEGAVYLRICLVFSLGMFLEICLERMIQVTGKTIYQMVSQLTGAIINIVLDPILIFGLFGAPKMGIVGAAAATVIGQWVGCFLSLILNITCNTEVRLRFADLRFHMPTIKGIYSVGLPSIIMQSISSIMNFGMNFILAGFSEAAVSVLGVYFKLQNFVFMPCFGMTSALIPIVGYNYGARKKDRIMQCTKSAMIFITIIMVLGTVLFQWMPGELIALFNDGGELARIGEPALRTISFSFVFAGIAIVLSSLFQALGEGLYSLLMSVFRQLGILLPVAWLLSLSGNIDLVWYAFVIAEAISLCFALTLFRHTYKTKIKVLESLSLH